MRSGDRWAGTTNTGDPPFSAILATSLVHYWEVSSTAKFRSMPGITLGNSLGVALGVPPD
jgi:hypothetical protein